MSDPQETTERKVPVFFLKTKSSPADAYEEQFSKPLNGVFFEPEFVPVLEHRFLDAGMDRVRSLLKGGKISRAPEAEYGGLIFTSQRAVEAFATLVEEEAGSGGDGWPHLQDVPVYSVGPATTRALRAVPQQPGLQVYGEHTGNGETLAPFILEHYGSWYQDRATKPPLLFLVGEQRRDVIPRVLMDDRLAPDRRVQVDEVVVYGTGVMASFENDLAAALVRAKEAERREVWVVVFSPTGCESMLRALGLLGATGGGGDNDLRRLIATIGPTTKAFLQKSLGFEPDVCASMPSPEGVWESISKYMTNAR
ncbi:hypothetical protein MAPG_03618 [Magnaporthiopsis poae ATCC 64411]|uniref:Tetrapyrrole biosynthesis uroporphyrinogen III synthase domain-containing protein n=1 Tax=Magnaporthiopsis poae (strain ATCC 64411 / 73-15) TaxID=644358 RepID=A0A0C4DUH9_MAGP6|nr:hypothetical protein MAPG_03618 [Magnaporthiopsis poae ATCC 64411]